jgi:acetyl esterase/lipase
MKTILLLILFFFIWNYSSNGQLPTEQPLWPNGIPNNPVKYKEEKVRTSDVRKSSVSQLNRIFSCVYTPTYILHKPEKPNGVALVICPGGGFRDVWLDREGNDFGIWLAQKGITCLVLKYRTFNTDAEGFSLTWNQYAPQVYADAKQAIYILHSKAKELGIDEHKIGISGFSAGGSLSLAALLEMYEKELPSYANFNSMSTAPDFACLVYPGLRQDLLELAKTKNSIPPVFIINGREDNVTPAKNCIDLYNILISKNVPAELHVYAKGNHGFDSGVEIGYGIATWRDSFIAWLMDTGFLKGN